ncbi:hypothetical protein MSG28_013021, partial [Choristoneura fumiferana]
MWDNSRNLVLTYLLLLKYGCALENLSSNQIELNDLNNPLSDASLLNCVVDLTQITVIFAPTILILENKKDDKDEAFFNKMTKAFANHDLPITIQDQDNYTGNQTYGAYKENVIVIVHFDNCKKLTDFDIHGVDKKVKYIIIISDYTEESFELLQRFVDEVKCKLADKIKPTQINSCSNSSLKTKVVFPDEVKIDIKKCPFKVGMATMYPFSKIPNKDKLNNYDLITEIEGSDVEIIKIIANRLNASIEWRYLRRAEENPFTDVEYVKVIRNGSLELCAGGLYNIYGDLVSYSGIYTRQAVIWIYAAHRSSRSWTKLVHQLHGMYLFFIFYISYCSLSYLIRKYDCTKPSLKDIVFYSWGALIGAASLVKPTSLKHKILDIFYLILSIYLASYMNIQLYSFLTIDRPAVMFKTYDEVFSSGRVPYLSPTHKWFLQEKNYLAFANTSKDCDGFYDCADKTLALNGLTAILDEYFYTLQAATAVNDEARVLRATQNIVTVYQEMLIRKDSPFVISIQKVIQRLFEAGICKHLYKEAIGITVVAKAESANKNAVSNSYSCESGCAITLTQVA